jgi:ankyrin repeat protein
MGFITGNFTEYPRGYCPQESKDKLSDLIIACVKQDYDQVVNLVEIKKVDVNFKTIDHQCAILHAVMKNNIKIVKYLHENGADINVIDAKNNNLLMMSIFLKFDDISAYLIINGINLNQTNKFNEKVVHFCAMHGNLFIMKMLFERGADMNSSNIRNHTPLIMSCGNKHAKCVKFLVENGIDVNGKDYKNDNLLHVCIQNNSYDIMLYFLIKKCSVINDKNDNGDTALCFAAMQNKVEYVKLLLKYGADPNINNAKYRNESPLYHAVKNNNYNMVKLLIENNANFHNRLYVFNGLMMIHGNGKSYKLGESILGASKKTGDLTIYNYLINLGAELFYEWD